MRFIQISCSSNVTLSQLHICKTDLRSSGKKISTGNRKKKQFSGSFCGRPRLISKLSKRCKNNIVIEFSFDVCKDLVNSQ